MSYGYDIPDAPWIEETMRTGHYKYGWWNQPDDDEDNEDEDDCVEVDLI